MSAWDAERRRELNEEFDHVFSLHDQISRDLNSDQNEQLQSLFKSVNKWEQNAMKKVAKTAQTAREDIQRVFDGSKQNLQRALNQNITEKLRQALQEEDKFTEVDIDMWQADLAAIKKQLNRLSSSIEFSHRNVIKLIEVKHNASMVPIGNAPFNPQQFRLQSIRGHAIFDYAQSLIRTTCPTLLVSENSYSHGSHYFRFRLEQSNDYLFFGIISAKDQEKLREKPRPISSIHGWWNLDRRVLFGRKEQYVSSLNIYNHDEVILILNCDARQLFLEYPSMNKSNRIELPHDGRECPSPWKILVEVGRRGQCLIRLQDWGIMPYGTS